MSLKEELIRNLNRTHEYTTDILNHTDQSDWFRQPVEGVTHIGWQVGHLAVCEYSLCIKRLRGVQESDQDLLSSEFLSRYGKGSTPNAAPEENATAEELLNVYHRVHEAAVAIIGETGEDELNAETTPSHPRFSTKAGAIDWSAQHELTHAGQISLLRRLLGGEPLR